MMRSMNIAASGMKAQELRVEVISNNLANVNTTAHKRARVEFADLMYQSVIDPGSQSSTNTIIPTGVTVGTGVRVVSTTSINTQGSGIETGNDLDVMISGDGYFQIELPNGQIAYTRDGSFKRSDQGELVTASGYVVQPSINIPPDATSVTINQRGVVEVFTQDNPEGQQAGQIVLARFLNPAGLRRIGDNLHVQSAASGQPLEGTAGDDSFGLITQYFLEGSNVSSVEELTELINAQRAYELNSKVVQTSDEMMQSTNNLR